MTPRQALRKILRFLLSTRRSRVLAARLVRPLLRLTAGMKKHHRLWTAVELTINREGTKATGHAWFGARLLCDLGDMVPQRIYYSGVWEPDISRMIASRLARGDTMIDVGANVGYFSLLASHLTGPTGRVFAIEPWPATVKILRQNIRLNDITNIEVVDQAVAARKENVTLASDSGRNSGAVSQLTTSPALMQLTVKAAPLIELVGIEALRQAKVIKIDIEGAEPAVLKELLTLADQLSSDLTIVAEVTPAAFNEYDWSLPQLLADFRSIGFKPAHINNDYTFDKNWWRFDPNQEIHLAPVDLSTSNRFDLVLIRKAKSSSSLATSVVAFTL